MYTFQSRRKDEIFLVGFFMIIALAILFSLPLLFNTTLTATNYFFVNFCITVAFYVVLLVSGRMRRGRDGLPLIFELLILCLISAYALNREMNVFEDSVNWLSALLIVSCVNYLCFSIIDSLHFVIRNIMFSLMGISVCLFVYMSFFVFPYYAIGLLGSPLLAISLHIFVPVLFVLFSIKLFRRHSRGQRNLRLSFYSGVAGVISLLTVFVTFWADDTNRINSVFRRATVNNDALPAWVNVAQNCASGWMDEKIIKADLVYAGLPEDNLFWRMPSRRFDEKKKHDPLIATAVFISGKLDLGEQDRIKVLESMYDSRHKALDRLWSGDNLKTDYINTNVRIWPEFGLAYTEKTVFVSKLKTIENWSAPGEAIYTFHLPEGSVVSSLSLWIDGKEEKGMLTTKEKADTAYKTIVGGERRDPSVVHWQEGNTVSIRIYPVNPGESRTFKIGVTTPLEKTGTTLAYRNIYFDGPPSDAATEDLSLAFNNKQKAMDAPEFVSAIDDQHYSRSGRYKADWKLSFPDPGLSEQAFEFHGASYRASAYHPQRAAAEFRTIYLDVNSSWSKAEFDKIFELTKNRSVFVCTNEVIQVDASNKDRLFTQLASAGFSLFPFYNIADPSHTLVISKSSGTSPNLGDLEASDFIKNTRSFLNNSSTIKLFHIGGELSPYLKSMQEYRVFDYEQGDINLLEELITKQEFAVSQENNNEVVICNSGLKINRSEESITSAAPDHLMRLFAYNHIMQTAGRRMFNKIPEDDELVHSAKEAGIVSPVSSLIVLETQADYNRFGIKNDIDGLGNASLKSKGAVPEPHEWLLIFAALSVFVYIRFKPARRNAEY